MRKILGVIFLLLSSAVYAIQNGTDVSSSDYESMNYLVNIEDADGHECGGMLLAGQWIQTARHCTASWYYEDANSSSGTNTSVDDDTALDGVGVTITVYQGVGGINGYNDGNSRIVYSGTAYLYTIGSTTEVDDALTTLLDNSSVESNLASSSLMYSFYSDGTTADKSTNLSTAIGDYQYGDVALLKLTKAIPYNKTLKLGTVADFSTLDTATASLTSLSDYQDVAKTETPTTGDTITFYGWGADENSEMPSVLQTATQTVDQLPFTISCTYVVTTTESSTVEDCADVDESTLMADDTFSRATPYVTLSLTSALTTKDNLVGSGDSGTPVIVNDTAVGVVHSVSTTESNFASLDGYIGWIESTIDSLNAPEEIELLNSDNDSSLTITVQNLSDTTRALDVAVADGDNVGVDDSACPSTLDPLESCDVAVTIYDPSLHQDFTIQLDAETSTLVSYVDTHSGTTISSASSDTSASTSTDSATSGGGSAGVWSIFSLLAIGLGRIRKKKSL